MALKVVTKDGKVATGEVLAKLKKQYGDSIGNYGGRHTEAVRIPTGLFELDMALGGGFPKGRTSIIFGPEDSGKSSVAYLLIANHQRLFEAEICVYIAIEPFDPEWAAILGVNLDKLIVLNPLFAEEAADMLAAMLEAPDVGLVLLDSLAAMITTQEAEKSAEGFNPGSSALAVGKLVRKCSLAMRAAERDGRTPTVIYINQTRFKIGVMFGNPEIMPGGNAPLFQAQLIVRFYGKAIKDNAVSDKFPVIREINFVLKKCKVPIMADAGKASMVTYPHKNLRPGETDDINTILTMLDDLGTMTKEKKGWTILGAEYPTQAAFKERVYLDREFGAGVRAAIVEAYINAHGDALKVSGKDMKITEDGEIIDLEPQP